MHLLNTRVTTFWGKLSFSEDKKLIDWLSLHDHCADVAACFEQLINQPVIGKCISNLCGYKDLNRIIKARLCFFAALHDLGKHNIGFQNKAYPDRVYKAGHVKEILSLFSSPESDEYGKLLAALDTEALMEWGSDESIINLFFATICHHGKPYNIDKLPSVKKHLWKEMHDLEPFKGIAELVRLARSWFPLAFNKSDMSLPQNTELFHYISGLITLADWLGSSREFFPYDRDSSIPRIESARSRAFKLVAEIGINCSSARGSLGSQDIGFDRISQYVPRPIQQKIYDVPYTQEGNLVILEAETGAGKTEAALAYFIRLFQAGIVDGMYFALPTRTAATQIHSRITAALERTFPDEGKRLPVVLAVPGYIKVDDTLGVKLPNFEVLWPDDNEDRNRYRYWAAEHPKRYMAGAVIVGTIDQVLLSALKVNHSHLRASALMRHLIIVDEVHASDSYMMKILTNVVHKQLSAGGNVLLMSATLGSIAKARFKKGDFHSNLDLLDQAKKEPYPLISSYPSAGENKKIIVNASCKPKNIEVEIVAGMDNYRKVAHKAIEAASTGAKVLIIRNTVKACTKTYNALEASGADKELLFNVKGNTTVHHSRFCRADRTSLDDAIQKFFSIRTQPHGGIACATQTVQQSLDLDADYIITDLCPMDVLLQRIGRLHRHSDNTRPSAYEKPRIMVLTPDVSLLSMIDQKGDVKSKNGIGTVYSNLLILEATIRLITEHNNLEIPEMARMLVEYSTHPEALHAIAAESKEKWQNHWNKIEGEDIAMRCTANINIADWGKEFVESGFPSFKEVEEKIQTRLGESDYIVKFDHEVGTPFGNVMRSINIPSYMISSTMDELTPEIIKKGRNGILFKIGETIFVYNKIGLVKCEI